MNEAKVKIFGQNNAKHLIWICFYTPATKTSSEVLSMLERTFWFGAATSGQETFGAIAATTNLKLYEEIIQENVGGEA